MEAYDPKFIEARVITTSGGYPETGFERVPVHERVATVLKKADDKLHITNTTGTSSRIVLWVTGT
jgi:hypothetical protein